MTPELSALQSLGFFLSDLSLEIATQKKEKNPDQELIKSLMNEHRELTYSCVRIGNIRYKRYKTPLKEVI